MPGGLTRLLQHPLTAGMDVDCPETTERRRIIIRSKGFLRRLYTEWYRLIQEHLPDGEGGVAELGSGAGFMKECMPEVITTEVLALKGIDIQIPPDGRLPFADAGLRAIVMTDVLHHIGTPRFFFNEAARTVRPGGAIVMIEPWVTPWSSFIYRRLHPEPFRPDASQWEFPAQGPLSGANGALPWIIFERDREQFEKEFPEWRITLIKPMMPFAYLLSGGVSMRALCPRWAYNVWRIFERGLSRIGLRADMFALVKLDRIEIEKETVA